MWKIIETYVPESFGVGKAVINGAAVGLAFYAPWKAADLMEQHADTLKSYADSAHNRVRDCSATLFYRCRELPEGLRCRKTTSTTTAAAASSPTEESPLLTSSSSIN